MYDLTSFYDGATGLYNFYKWGLYNGIPKELFDLIILCYDNYPKCIFCTLGCCRYDDRRYEQNTNKWIYYSNHANENRSPQKIVDSLLDQFEKDRTNKSIIGKLVLISFTKNESTQIPIKICAFVDKMLKSSCIVNIDALFEPRYLPSEGHKTFAINVFGLGYEPIFFLLGCIFSNIDTIYNTPHKPTYWGAKERTYRNIKFYLRSVREACCVYLYGKSNIEKDYQYYHYDSTKDLGNLFNCIKKRYFQ
jgi:hypothetical protein